MIQIIALTSIAKEKIVILLEKFTHARSIKPRMDYKVISIISEILRRKKPRRCLEWGAGYSTVFFPKYLRGNALWIAVEHNMEWYHKTKQNIKRLNTNIYYLPPNNFPWTDMYEDGAYSDLKDYVEFPKTLNSKFDFILIDGQARKYCLLCALDILDKNGVVVLHNANREYYQEPLKLYKHQVLFYEFGGLWIGSINLNLQTVLNIKKHEQIYKMHSTLARIKKSVYSLFKLS
jgi:predicted O-methyltransferase YrrM